MKKIILCMAASIGLMFTSSSVFSSGNQKSYFLLGKHETLRMNDIVKQMTESEKEVAPKNKVYYLKLIEPYSLTEDEAVNILSKLGNKFEDLFGKIVQLSESGEMININGRRKHDIGSFIPFIQAIDNSKCDDEQKQIIQLLACGEFFEYYFSRMSFFNRNNYKFTEQERTVFKFILETLDKLTGGSDPLITNISSYLLASYYVLSNQKEDAQNAIDKFNKSEYTSFLQNEINGLERIIRNKVVRDLKGQSKFEFIYSNAEIITQMNKKYSRKIDSEKFKDMHVSLKGIVLGPDNKPLNEVYIQTEYTDWSGSKRIGYHLQENINNTGVFEYHEIGKIGLNLKFIKDGYKTVAKSFDFTNLDPSVERHTLDDVTIKMEENGYPKLKTIQTGLSFYSKGGTTYFNFTILQKIGQEIKPNSGWTIGKEVVYMDDKDFRVSGITMPNDYMTVECPIGKDGLIDVALKEKRNNYFIEYPKYFKLVYSGENGGFIVYEPKNELNGFEEMDTAPESGYSKELLFKYPDYRKKLYTYLFVKSKNLYGKMRIDSGMSMNISYYMKRKREKETDYAGMPFVIKINMEGSRDLRTMPDSQRQSDYDERFLKFFYERQKEEAINE